MGATKKVHYRRIMLKLSGEALLGKKNCGIDTAVIKNIAREIKPLLENKVQLGIIIGGGNFFRGAKLKQNTISRITGDYLGMLATMMNALAMRDVFAQVHIPTKIMSALPITGILEGYDRIKADNYLNQNFVIIFAGGIGNPLVTTDTALSLRGIELNADLLIKATNVCGICSSDPRTNSKAKLYTHLTYKEVLTRELEVMDLAAFCLCRDHQMKLQIFNMKKSGALLRIVQGTNEGTLVE